MQNLEVRAEIVNKNGAKGALTLISDDGDQRTSDFFYTVVAPRYSAFKLTVAMPTGKIASLVKTADGKAWKKDENGKYVLTVKENAYESAIEGSVFRDPLSHPTTIDFWKQILSHGSIELASHSHTHAAWGLTDEQNGDYPAGNVIKELHASAQILRELLGHAEYQYSYRENDRGVYTFCMCPGGEVVAGASEEGGVVVNGMSRYARDGRNSNCAVCVSVTPEDCKAFGGTMEFCRTIEKKAYALGGGGYAAPIETVGDFLTDAKRLREPSKVMPTYMVGKNVKVARLDYFKQLVDLAKEICEKWGVAVADVYYAGTIDTTVDAQRVVYSYNNQNESEGNGNGTHLTGIGYDIFYAPVIVRVMAKCLANENQIS